MSNSTATIGYQNRYGAVETEGLVDGQAYHNEVDYTETYSLRGVSEAGGKISRVRLLTEYIPAMGGRVADVSYIHAVLPGGKIVPVRNGMNNLCPMNKVKGEMIEWAKREGVFAKGLGLLDEGNWSTVS